MWENGRLDLHTTKKYTNFTDVSALDGIAVESEEKDYITLFLLNRGTENLEVACVLRDYPNSCVEEMIAMTCNDLKAGNSANHPDKVVPHLSNAYEMKDDQLTISLKPYSWNVVRVKINISHRE